MTEPTTLGLPFPWILKRHFIRGDRFFFFSVSPCTLCFGFEFLRDGFVLLLGPMNIGWASISSARRRAAQRIEARSDETLQAAQPEGQEPDGEADAPNLGRDK